jgi:hypothetical protein
MILQKLKYLIILLTISISGICQINMLPEYQEPGKCYAKCFVGGNYEEYEEVLFVYIGENNPAEDQNLEIIELEIDNGKSWVKKKSINGKEVYCMVEEESEKKTEEIIVVKDTTQTKDYVVEYFTKKRPISKPEIEWREVICGDEVDSKLIIDIQNGLVDNGYIELNITGKLDSKTKSILTEYQKANGLPIGNLNIETMNSLKINY